MPKESVTKKTIITKVEHGASASAPANRMTIGKKSFKKKVVSKGIEKSLAENIVELQRINTTLAERFDRLAEQISKLLGLFEITAKTFAENPSLKASDKDREFLEKIDKLLEQNKTIAKGLMLVEERAREKVYSSQPQQTASASFEEEYRPGIAGKKPLPRF